MVDLFEYLKHSILEFFMLQIFGVGEFATNHGAVWFVSVLLVANYTVFSLLFVEKEKFRAFTGPLIIVVGYLWIFVHTDSIILDWFNSSASIFTQLALIRGIAGVALGAFLYLLVDGVNDKYAIKIEIASIIGGTCYFIAFLFMTLGYNSYLILLVLSGCAIFLMISLHDESFLL